MVDTMAPTVITITTLLYHLLDTMMDTKIVTMDGAMMTDRGIMMIEEEIEVGVIEMVIRSEVGHTIGGHILIHVRLGEIMIDEGVITMKKITIGDILKRSIGIGGTVIVGAEAEAVMIDEVVEDGQIALIERDGPPGVIAEETRIIMKMLGMITNHGHETLEVVSDNEKSTMTRRDAVRRPALLRSLKKSMVSNQKRQVKKGASAHLVRGRLAESRSGRDIAQEEAEASVMRKMTDIIIGDTAIDIELKVQRDPWGRLRHHLLGGAVVSMLTDIDLERNTTEVVL